ncbi:glutamine amidotransferase-related protein [Rickettsiales endosymbiont of Stachyamoeba lipophora]|uniref:glutamine amidotransferase-related protein n=1 Tax=Rickettsiales endosymbiont of Stachyamoeba lipophora TaxID=2486578 RepID=UPI000F65181D|nr:GMP synthase [Rickettsiales endosymbiont of Stachyamoeba lipophora]
MNILCITHADFETPGIIESWAQALGYNFTICRPYKGDNCSEYNNFDFLIIMGGPQNALKMQESPYLEAEIKLIAQAIKRHKIVLGFCLGAQLIGEALNAKTEHSPEKEIGVFPIALTPEAQDDYVFKGMNKEFSAIHWHKDMPGLTTNSVILAYSKGCPRQIIRYGTNIYGLQCHLEITKEGIKDLIEACPQDLSLSKFTQTKDELLKQDFENINQMMLVILNRLVFNQE